MANWEYLVAVVDADNCSVKVGGETKSISDYLDSLGEDEWELVAVAPRITVMGDVFDNSHILYLKRKIEYEEETDGK